MEPTEGNNWFINQFVSVVQIHEINQNIYQYRSHRIWIFEHFIDLNPILILQISYGLKVFHKILP